MVASELSHVEASTVSSNVSVKVPSFKFIAAELRVGGIISACAFNMSMNAARICRVGGGFFICACCVVCSLFSTVDVI